MTRWPVFRHPVTLRSIETNYGIGGNEVACLLSNVWGEDACFDILMEVYFFFCHLTLSFALLSFFHRHHCCFAVSTDIHKAIWFIMPARQWNCQCRSQWSCEAWGVCHQNVYVVIFVPYHFTLWSRRGKACGLTHGITHCSHWSHVFWSGCPSAPSRRKSCLQLLTQASVAWCPHTCF
jgi:hypothetical protein